MTTHNPPRLSWCTHSKRHYRLATAWQFDQASSQTMRWSRCQWWTGMWPLRSTPAFDQSVSSHTVLDWPQYNYAITTSLRSSGTCWVYRLHCSLATRLTHLRRRAVVGWVCSRQFAMTTGALRAHDHHAWCDSYSTHCYYDDATQLFYVEVLPSGWRVR